MPNWYTINYPTTLHTHNETQKPTAARRWHFALRDVSRRQSCHSQHLATPGFPQCSVIILHSVRAIQWGDSVKKVKEIAPQVGFELTPLEERSFHVKSSTTELQKQILDYSIIYVYFTKNWETEIKIGAFPVQVLTSTENQKCTPIAGYFFLVFCRCEYLYRKSSYFDFRFSILVLFF